KPTPSTSTQAADSSPFSSAARWRLPDVIRAGMADDDHAAHADAFDDEDDDARHAEPAADDGPAERIRWLRAVSRCST
ncbi:hypothetical protein QM326_39065, partial [Burkholderia cenocepacia]|nr:hypothetical protein [Burkholderia cenocepacia]